jgi:hypothetical protein
LEFARTPTAFDLDQTWRAHAALATTLALLALSFARSADAKPVDLDASVPGHGAVTYFDLLRQVLPDLAKSEDGGKARGHLAKPWRHIAGGGEGGDPPDPIEIGSIEAVRIRAGGKPRIAVLADLGPSPDRVASTTVLALFDESPDPRLLDAADVGVDRDTSLAEHERLRLGPGDDAVVTYSEHSNTSQTYAAHVLVFARRDRLRLLQRVSTLSHRECGWLLTQDPTFTVLPGPARPYGQLAVAVREVMKSEKTDCDHPPPRPYARTYRATYHWDAAKGRFTTPSHALERLDKLNAARF